eukprot:GILJ01009674.1.p1 GENE.GILJ01009674.1~~GILJ01009674.1.p1  ORF type:complete len:1144 (-),score=204.35 GILJ01009674.1:11-3442(-)
MQKMDVARRRNDVARMGEDESEEEMSIFEDTTTDKDETTQPSSPSQSIFYSMTCESNDIAAPDSIQPSSISRLMNDFAGFTFTEKPSSPTNEDDISDMLQPTPASVCMPLHDVAAPVFLDKQISSYRNDIASPHSLPSLTDNLDLDWLLPKMKESPPHLGMALLPHDIASPLLLKMQRENPRSATHYRDDWVDPTDSSVATVNAVSSPTAAAVSHAELLLSLSEIEQKLESLLPPDISSVTPTMADYNKINNKTINGNDNGHDHNSSTKKTLFQPKEVVLTVNEERLCTVERLIGRGGMGEVYLIDVDGQPLAMKCLSVSKQQKPQHQQQQQPQEPTTPQADLPDAELAYVLVLAYHNYGVVLEVMGDVSRAVAWYEKALRKVRQYRITQLEDQVTASFQNASAQAEGSCAGTPSSKLRFTFELRRIGRDQTVVDDSVSVYDRLYKNKASLLEAMKSRSKLQDLADNVYNGGSQNNNNKRKNKKESVLKTFARSFSADLGGIGVTNHTDAKSKSINVKKAIPDFNDLITEAEMAQETDEPTNGIEEKIKLLIKRESEGLFSDKKGGTRKLKPVKAVSRRRLRNSTSAISDILKKQTGRIEQLMSENPLRPLSAPPVRPSALEIFRKSPNNSVPLSASASSSSLSVGTLKRLRVAGVRSANGTPLISSKQKQNHRDMNNTSPYKIKQSVIGQYVPPLKSAKQEEDDVNQIKTMKDVSNEKSTLKRFLNLQYDSDGCQNSKQNNANAKTDIPVIVFPKTHGTATRSLRSSFDSTFGKSVSESSSMSNLLSPPDTPLKPVHRKRSASSDDSFSNGLRKFSPISSGDQNKNQLNRDRMFSFGSLNLDRFSEQTDSEVEQEEYFSELGTSSQDESIAYDFPPSSAASILNSPRDLQDLSILSRRSSLNQAPHDSALSNLDTKFNTEFSPESTTVSTHVLFCLQKRIGKDRFQLQIQKSVHGQFELIATDAETGQLVGVSSDLNQLIHEFFYKTSSSSQSEFSTADFMEQISSRLLINTTNITDSTAASSSLSRVIMLFDDDLTIFGDVLRIGKSLLMTSVKRLPKGVGWIQAFDSQRDKKFIVPLFANELNSICTVTCKSGSLSVTDHDPKWQPDETKMHRLLLGGLRFSQRVGSDGSSSDILLLSIN